MKRDAAVSLIIGYLATYHRFFTEPFTVFERVVATIGIGLIVFSIISKEGGRRVYG